jgi:hypothetical protein
LIHNTRHTPYTGGTFSGSITVGSGFYPINQNLWNNSEMQDILSPTNLEASQKE